MIETNTMVGTGMKVVCQREELSQKLGVVARAVSTRASVQILSGALLRAEAGRLRRGAAATAPCLPPPGRAVGPRASAAGQRSPARPRRALRGRVWRGGAAGPAPPPPGPPPEPGRR